MNYVLATHQNILFLQKALRKRTYENCKSKISYGLPLLHNCQMYHFKALANLVIYFIGITSFGKEHQTSAKYLSLF